MTSRQKRISWIVAGVVVQGLVIFGTIYYMEFRYAGEMSEARDILSGRIPPSAYPVPVTPLTESASPVKPSPQVRELIKIERGSATEIAKTIRELFGERAKVSAVESSSSVVVMADHETLTDILEFIRQLSGRSGEMEEAQSNLTGKDEELIVESLPEPQSAIPDPSPPVSAFPNRDEIDPFASQPEATPHRNELKYFSIRNGSPENIAAAVKDVFGNTVKVTPENRSQLVIVVADPEIQVRVGEFIAQIEERTGERDSENRKVIELREKQRAEEIKRSTEESLKQFERSQPPVVRTQTQTQTRPLSDERADDSSYNPFESPSPQQENISSTIKFPADAQDTEMDRNAKQLVLRIRSAKPDEQANLRKELENITVRQFQHRQQRRQQEFESLSQRLEKLKASHQRRQKHQAEVVERRIKDLLDPNSDLRWEERELSDERPTDVSNSLPLGENEAALPREVDVNLVLPTGEPKNGDSKEPEPTYNGVTLSEWLRMLKTERNEEKFIEAVTAMNYLADQADPAELTRTLFRILHTPNFRLVMERNVTLPGVLIDARAVAIVRGLMHLLIKLPAAVVVEDFLSEIDRSAGEQSPKEFLGWFLHSLEANALWESYGGSSQSNWDVQSSLQKRLRMEIRRRSRELISHLVAVAMKDESLTNWSVRCAEKIIRMSDQTLTTYPDLVPLVNRLFDKPVAELPWYQSNSPFYQRPIAAVLLGESGLRIPEILTYATEKLERGYFALPPGSQQIGGGAYQHQFRIHQRPTDFEDGLRCLVAIAPYSPEAIGLLTDLMNRNFRAILGLLEERDAFNKPTEGSTTAELDASSLVKLVEETALCINSLAEIGVPAAPSIPQLKVIVETPKFGEMYTSHRHIQEFNPGGNMVGQMSLVDLAKAAIKIINESKPKPKPEPLPDDNLESQENVSAWRITSPNGQSQTLVVTPPTHPIDETTYDGITYTQWLKLLETERKLDKVIAAIDACTRLAVKGDERRIAKGVFVAEALFESEGDLKTEAWTVGQIGLSRLPTEIVIDELLLALRNPISYEAGRQFQYQFQIEFEHFRVYDQKAAQIEILRSRSTEIVQELVRLIPAEPQADSLPAIAAASQVCNLANRSINDFDGLTDRMIKVVRAVPADEKKIRFDLWMIVARTLTQQAPNTPDLAIILAKQAEKYAPASYPIVELLGKLGSRAEPAVPAIVQLFLVELNRFETTFAPRPTPSSPDSEGRRISDNSHHMRMQVIQAIGEIGQGQVGFDLVWELKNIIWPEPTRGSIAKSKNHPGYQDLIKEMITEAGSACSKFVGYAHSKDHVLSDIWIMNGFWAEAPVIQLTDFQNTSSIKLNIRGPLLIWDPFSTNQNEFSNLLLKFGHSSSMLKILLVDDAGTGKPKKLKLVSFKNVVLGEEEAPNSIAGLYHLTNSTLKMQLAPPGQPAPEEFCTDRNSLPEGHVLLELQRISPVPSDKGEKVN